MEYELRCTFLANEELFAYVITNKETKDFFEWTVSSVEKTRFLLTNNGIIFKCTPTDNNLIFEVAKSNGTDIKEKFIANPNGNYMIFSSDSENISIVYDFYDFPDTKREIAGSIIGEMLITNGGGFLEDDSEYLDLENKIIDILEKYKLFEQNKTKRSSKTTRTRKTTAKKVQVTKEEKGE